VTEVGKVADASSGVATYPVTVTFTADPTKVWVGSTATADITTGKRDDVTLVSSRAVTTANGVSTVTVAVDGTVDGRTEQRTVTTGETSGQDVEVTSGLEVGEKVIEEVPGLPGGAGGTGGLPTGSSFPGGGASTGSGS
jgi:macrolide-specific efflux system membrane fusion protein